MAIDFPGSPTNGQTYTVGSVTYTYDGTKWTAVTGSVMLDKIQEGNTSAEVIDTGSDGRFVVTTEGSERLRVDSSGRLGIGTTSPAQSFHLNNARGSTFRYTSTSSDLLDIGWASSSYGAASAGDAHFYTNTGDYCFMADNASKGIKFATGGSTERARIDSSGRLLVGTTSSTGVVGAGSYTPSVQIARAANANLGLYGYYADAAGDGATLIFTRSKSNTIGTNTIVQSGDELGAIWFAGANGTGYDRAALIKGEVDGTPGSSGDMPGRLIFSTTADGASSPTERMRIDANGYVNLSVNSSQLAQLRFHGAGTRLEYSDSSGNLSFYTNSSSRVSVGYGGGLLPTTDNGTSLGGPGNRWIAVYAVNGTIQTSDEREKTFITDATLGIDFVKSLRPVSYKWIEGGQRETGERNEDESLIYESVPGQRTHWGFIAQEVKQAVDAAGVDFGGWVLIDKDDPDSQQALRYDQFIAPLTKALQEALEKIETLEAKVAALEAS